MTRVAYLIHSAAPSGAELALGRALSVWPTHSTVEVHLAADGPVVDTYRRLGVRVHVRPLSEASRATRRDAGARAKAAALLALLRYAVRLRRELRGSRPDVVVAGSLKAVVYARIATAFSGTPLVWSVHDRVGRDYLGPAAPFFSRVLPSLVDGIIVNSRATLASLTAGRTPVLICPPGARLRRVARPVGEQVRNIAVLGRLSPWKGQLEAVRAFASAALPSSTRLHLIGGALFGEHDYESVLRETVAELGVDDRVVFHGHVDDPRFLLEEMDMLAHTSVLPEPFGSVVLEGMDAGCVVIASRPGGPAEVVQDGVNGFLVPCGDVDALREALTSTAALGPGARRELVAAGHRTTGRYAIGVTTPARAGFIRAIARGRRLPAVTEWHQWTEEMDR
ncbi:glycosyltransferase family 4 protein [Nocardioides sp. ChNu-153]|uniref:glycosyltransferase family 4 protein n=1 Tax=unclassified Nocardioides TaxID=2615069 RepID=UPI002407761E|nr:MULTISPECIES: glycosyltransferase family 4 protein [unclassified Nocardioides]MDF9715026.1 glycosyltransferase family 4 protein [Nocardioides sp. ChNu-99]MDN7122295.1 glycosyltransferase family 4 protein [Nocardioides sp. ChNu-153]